MILPDDPVEEQQSQQRPEGDQNIGLRGDGVIGEGAREQKEDGEGAQNKQTDPADQTLLFRALLPGQLKDRHGREAVNDGGADRRGVHDPSDGRSADEGYGQGHQEHQKNGVGRDLLAVQPGKALRQDAVLRHGIAQPA